MLSKNNKERFWKEASEIYQNLSEEEKHKRQKRLEKISKSTKEEKEKRRNKNLFEEQKQKLVEYKKKLITAHDK